MSRGYQKDLLRTRVSDPTDFHDLLFACQSTKSKTVGDTLAPCRHIRLNVVHGN